MTGATLLELRERVESLACDSGEYCLVCARHGGRPVPVDGCRFESRAAARTAARVTERYRARLRQYDPQLPRCAVVVSRTDADGRPARPSLSRSV